MDKNAIRLFRECKGLVILAGAGMGVDSGLPDFRGPEGFWKAYPPLKAKGLTFPEVSTPLWFENDPEFAWGFFGHRLNLYRRTEPHAGFAQLLRAANEKPYGYFVVTSNVDGHFQKAGFDPERVCEVHGSINRMQCTSGCSKIWDTNFQIDIDEITLRAKHPLPTCRRCKSLARPNILMFNDYSFIPTETTRQVCLPQSPVILCCAAFKV